MLSFTKSRRAQNKDDYETWIQGGVVPTLNVFDNNGDVRATVLIVYSFDSLSSNSMKSSNPFSGSREIKISKTLDTSNGDPSKNQGGQVVLILDGTRVDDVRVTESETMQTVISRWGTGGGNVPYIANQEMIVRRLTPVECERLQGFPDNWTASQSDSQRYKQMGNAVTVNVIEWIGKQIMENSNG